MGGNARDTQFSERKRSHYRLLALYGSVVCHSKAQQGDTVANASTHHRKGRLDKEYSYITVYQILAPCAVPKHALKDQAINPSLTRRFAHYGSGQYLTDLAPEEVGKGGLKGLSQQLFGQTNVAWKLTHYVEVNVEGLNIIEGRANVFLVPGNSPLDIAQRIVRFGSTLP